MDVDCCVEFESCDGVLLCVCLADAVGESGVCDCCDEVGNGVGGIDKGGGGVCNGVTP